VENCPAGTQLVAILNGTAEILETLEECLRSEGFTTVTAITTQFKKGKEDFLEFIKNHNPAVILYDVPPPYDENLTFLRLLKDTHSMDERCVILMTTNKVALKNVTGVTDAIEIIGKPFDLDILIKAVREKLKVCPKAA
jgi:DNA-binding response OmpR family regulator